VNKLIQQPQIYGDLKIIIVSATDKRSDP